MLIISCEFFNVILKCLKQPFVIYRRAVLFSHHFTYLTLSFSNTPVMADSMMSKAATMEIPINSNGDSRNLAEDDSLEQVSDTW